MSLLLLFCCLLLLWHHFDHFDRFDARGGHGTFIGLCIDFKKNFFAPLVQAIVDLLSCLTVLMTIALVVIWHY